jgi:hypothetical protein
MGMDVARDEMLSQPPDDSLGEPLAEEVARPKSGVLRWRALAKNAGLQFRRGRRTVLYVAEVGLEAVIL